MRRQNIAKWFRKATQQVNECTTNRIARWISRVLAYLDRSPNLRLVPRFFRLYHKYRVNSLAAEIAFYLLLAIFPLMIFVVSLAGLFGQTTYLSPESLEGLKELIPEPVYDLLRSVLDEIVSNVSTTFISISMLAILWSASSGLSVLLKGLFHIHGRVPKLNFLLRRALVLLMTFSLVLGMVLSIVLVTFGDLLLDQLAKWTGTTELSVPFLVSARFLVTFVFLVVFFLMLYLLVARRPVRFFQILPGALFSSSAWLILSLGFSWYVSLSGRYAVVYGSLIGMVILMLWLYLCSIVMLNGGILNVLLKELHEEKARDAAHEHSE